MWFILHNCYSVCTSLFYLSLNNVFVYNVAPVNNVQVEDIDGTSVRVTWEPLDIPEITGYRVYYPLSESRKRQSGGFKDVEGREMSSTIVDGLRSGSTYSFSVVSLASLNGEDPIVGEIMSGVTHVVRPPCGKFSMLTCWW